MGGRLTSPFVLSLSKHGRAAAYSCHCYESRRAKWLEGRDNQSRRQAKIALVSAAYFHPLT